MSNEPKTEEQTDDQLIASTWERFARALEPHDVWALEAAKFENFVCGEQWASEDLEKLKESGRPALTINLTKATVLTVTGEQQKMHTEMSFKPRNSQADNDTATIMAQVAQFIDNDARYDEVIAQVFFDACVTDRGYLDVRMGYDRNVHGDVTLVADNPKQVLLDPDCRTYDPDEWPGVFESYWRSVDFIEATYGKEKADKIRLGASLDFDFVDASTSIKWADDRVARNSSSSSPSLSNDRDGDRLVETVRIVEHQYFVHKLAWCFVDPVTGDIVDPRCDLEEEQLQEIAMQRNVELVQMMRKRVRWCVVARNVLLFSGWSPYPFLTKIGMFPMWMRGRPVGIVRDLISPQEQLNKIESQELHVINTTANSGWMYEDGSILNMDDDEMKASGAETGLVLKVRKGVEFPQKIQPNQIPTGLAHKAAKNVEYIQRVSAVNDAMLGFSSPEVSGVVVGAKKDSGITSIMPSFTNLKKTRNTLARRIMWMIQNFYTQPRLVRITDYSTPERPEVDVAINVPDAMGNVLNNVTLGRYDVVVSSIPARDTHEDGQFSQMMEMRGADIMVPDDEIIRRSNLSDKFPLAERVAKMQGLGEPSEEEVRIQGMLQELDMQKMQLEVAKLQAEANEITSRAELNMAKVETLRAEALAMGGEQGPNPEVMKIVVEREKIAADLQKSQASIQAQLAQTQMQLENKIQIATIQVGAKEKAMLHQSAIKRAQEGNKTVDTQRKEKLDAAMLAYKAMLQEQQIAANERIAAKKAATKTQPAKKKA